MKIVSLGTTVGMYSEMVMVQRLGDFSQTSRGFERRRELRNNLCARFRKY